MASTKLINMISDEELSRLVWAIVEGEGDKLDGYEITRDAGNAVGMTFRYRTRLDDEDEDSFLNDYYEIDDYDIDPWDWGGDTTKITKMWRTMMLAKFGTAYALDYLFQGLGESESVPLAKDVTVDMPQMAEPPAQPDAMTEERSEVVSRLRNILGCPSDLYGIALYKALTGKEPSDGTVCSAITTRLIDLMDDEPSVAVTDIR